MPITISSACWTKWRSMIKKLAKTRQFPAKSEKGLNEQLALFTGEGSTFRFETTGWNFVIDTVRKDDTILDIVAITLISKSEAEAKDRTGWVIAPQCPIHLREDSDEDKKATAKSDGVKLMWYRVTDGGKYTAYCCKAECEGPFRPGPRRVFDTARQGIVLKVLERQVTNLGDALETAKAKSSQDVELVATNKTIRKELARFEQETILQDQKIQDMTEENRKLAVENAKLTGEEKKLANDNRKLIADNKKLVSDNTEVTADRRTLEDLLSQVRSEQSRAVDERWVLRRQLDELHAARAQDLQDKLRMRDNLARVQGEKRHIETELNGLRSTLRNLSSGPATVRREPAPAANVPPQPAQQTRSRSHPSPRDERGAKRPRR